MERGPASDGYDVGPITSIDISLANLVGSTNVLRRYEEELRAKGKRYALENARNLMHQPLLSGVMEGQATDLEIEAREMLRIREFTCLALPTLLESVDSGMRNLPPTAQVAGQQGDATHEGAADTENVEVHEYSLSLS